MQSEKANAVSMAAAELARGVQLTEVMEAHGVYVVEHRGPRDEDRPVYLNLRSEAETHERAGEIADAAIIRAKMRSMEVVKSVDTFDNLVTTVGKNDALDKYLAGSAYTAAWYMGLISSTSYSAVAAGDTMASHAGWLEAGSGNTPVYSQGARPTTAWSAASAGAKALSAALTFSFTGSGTVKGCFINSVATKDGTTGILLSAGLFTGGDKTVANGDSLAVSYSLSL